jgi:hypothetical protein
VNDLVGGNEKFIGRGHLEVYLRRQGRQTGNRRADSLPG